MKRRNYLVTLSTAIVLMLSGMTAQAVEVVGVPAEEIDTVYNQTVQSNQLEGWAEGPQIYSEAGIVMDIDSGAILYAKNIDAPHYPASITKIMTALVALENNALTDIVTISQEDVSFLEYGDAHIGLTPGEEITMEDAMYGMLLASGNEVSHAIASNTEGGYEHFLKLMNEKAKELGCTNSHFMNPHGLHDENHYVSAHDMALIGAAVFQYEEFRTITLTQQYTIPETNLVNETRTVYQNHKMLYEWHDQYYEYCVGGKTGFTNQSLNTLVTFATKDDVNLVAVVLRTHGGNVNAYSDTEAMLDYAFENFSKTAVTATSVEATGIKSVDKSAYVMLPMGITFEQLDCAVENPTDVEDKTGKVIYSYEGQTVGEFEMTITDEYYNKLHGIEDTKNDAKNDSFKGNSVFTILLKVLLVVVIVIVVLFLALFGFATYRRAQIRKRRKAERMKNRRQTGYER